MEERFTYRVPFFDNRGNFINFVYCDMLKGIDPYNAGICHIGDIELCTGLKDKNGKLIYENDIIVIPNQYPFYDYKDRDNKKIDLNETCGEIRGESILNYIGIVEWVYSSWQYVYHCVNPQKQGISEGMNNLLNEIGYEEGQKTEFEIIGNIYENKELLKEKDNGRK